MSMLAESRRKNKVSLNPRGKWWTEDPNKFGQKMLEKMGWTKGKGLGVNEQGITEYSIKSTQKNCTSGIGYDKNLEKWTEHNEKFSGILKQLQENQDQDIIQKIENKDDSSNKQSLELKSKGSRARVHYQKFIRGKDIDKYKSKDLANIFGQKELPRKIQIKIEKEKKEITEIRDNWHGVTTINGGNMTDYFKLKSNCKNMTNHVKFKPNSNLSSNITDQTLDSENENKKHVGFGFTSNIENTLLSNYEISQDSSKKSNYAFDNPCLRLNSPTKVTSSDGPFKKSSKKRKNSSNITGNQEIDSKSKNEQRVDFGFALNTENISNYEVSKDSNKKSNYVFDNPCLKLNSPTKVISTNGPSKKSSKKRKNLSSNVTGNEEIDSKKNENEQCVDFRFVSNTENILSSNYEVSEDSNKKSNYVFDNPCLKLNSPTKAAATDGPSKKSSKKRKNLSNNVTDNQAIDSKNENEQCVDFKFASSIENTLSNYEMSKDSSKKSNYAFDNPYLRLNSPMKATDTDDPSKKSSKKRKNLSNNVTDNQAIDFKSENEHCVGFEFASNTENTSSNYEISKDSTKQNNYAFDNPCLRLNSPIKATDTDGPSKKSSKKRKNLSNNITDQAINSKSENEQCIGFEFASNTENILSSNYEISKDSIKSNYAFDNPCLRLNSPTETASIDDSSKKSSKKRKKELEIDNMYTDEINKHGTKKKLKTETFNCNGFTNPALDLNSDPKEHCNGKDFEISRAQFGLENCGLDLTDERCDTKRVTFNDHIVLYEYDKNCIKKKKGKHRLDKFEVENKKHKKKQKFENIITSPVSNGFVNKALDVETLNEGINDNKLNECNDIFPECKVISVSDQSVGRTHGPSNAKERMSKKMLITLFHKNAISDFPGSNIYEIKGYGADDC